VLEYPGGKGGGINTKRYCKQVLDGALVDFYTKVKNKQSDIIYFQQDNALCHTSKKT